MKLGTPLFGDLEIRTATRRQIMLAKLFGHRHTFTDAGTGATVTGYVWHGTLWVTAESHAPCG